MFDSRRSRSTEVEWDAVSDMHPCPICRTSGASPASVTDVRSGGRAGCRMQSDASFACCVRVYSDWPMIDGTWLHRLAVSHADHDLQADRSAASRSPVV